MKTTSKKIIYVPRTDRRISIISRHYGVTHQLNKTMEELFELFMAILKLRLMIFLNREKKAHFEHLYEEMSDVRIMIDQVEVLTASASRCREIRENKLDRQLTRIQGETK
jgi:hypothetical protein|nr:MAG TPA: nucleoside triphosphate pyrophosphohydrolase [Caudoviricetes sp.]